MGSSSVTLGRSKEVDATILDSKVSREHARVIFKGGRHHLEDLKSTNGTFVERRQIEKIVPLENEQFFQVGSSLFLFTNTSLRERAGQLAHEIKDGSMERGELYKSTLTGALHEMVQEVVGKKQVHKRQGKRLRPGSLKWMLQSFAESTIEVDKDANQKKGVQPRK